MSALSELLNGFGTALTPENLLFALVGVILGTAVGVLPGIGPAMTVALLLPVTYVLEPTSAFIMFAGIYYGGMYGGSTTSILLNTPGESSSVVTAIEGNKMARAGRAAQALATAAIGSFVAGTIGTLLLVFVAPLVVSIAISIGAPEYFARHPKPTHPRDLVEHEWLFLHRIDSLTGAVSQRRRDGWHALDKQ